MRTQTSYSRTEVSGHLPYEVPTLDLLAIATEKGFAITGEQQLDWDGNPIVDDVYNMNDDIYSSY